MLFTLSFSLSFNKSPELISTDFYSIIPSSIYDYKSISNGFTPWLTSTILHLFNWVFDISTIIASPITFINAEEILIIIYAMTAYPKLYTYNDIIIQAID